MSAGQLSTLINAVVEESSSDSEEGMEPLASLLSTPKSIKGPSGLKLSSTASKIVRQLPVELQPQLTSLIDQHRHESSSLSELEQLKRVFEQRESMAQYLTAGLNLLPLHVVERRVLPAHRLTRLVSGCHLSILPSELQIRLQGGSLESDVLRRSQKIQDKALRSEYITVGMLLVLLCDEVEPCLFLSLSTAERMMRRLVGWRLQPRTVAAPRKR